jgi:hypothetical protein
LPPKKADTIGIDMNQTILRESVMEAPVKKGNLWRVIVAKPGKGSSGTYSAEVFKRDAAKMLPPGAQAFINHDEARKPTDMIGVYEKGGSWDDDLQAVVSDLRVFEHWGSFVEEVGPHCGISLYALGEQDDEGNVTAFVEDVYNGADLVARPGLVGSGIAEKLYESALAASAKSSAELSAQERKETMEMDEKAIEAINALTAQVSALVSSSTAKVEAEAQHEADEKAVEEALATRMASIEAIEAAREELLPSQVKHLMAEAKTGKDVAPLIEAAKEVAAEAKASVESGPVGRVLGEAKTVSYEIGGWSK